nr:hypothetical protein [Tanacetum cinerariifolium]
EGVDKVLERGPWIICNTPLILNRWTPNVSLKKDEKKGIIRSGADIDSMTKDGANAINKIKCPSTSNSFDALNIMDVDDEGGTSTSTGNQKDEQELRHNMSQVNDHDEYDDEVDEFIFPEGDKFGDKFDIRLKGRVKK